MRTDFSFIGSSYKQLDDAAMQHRLRLRLINDFLCHYKQIWHIDYPTACGQTFMWMKSSLH